MLKKIAQIAHELDKIGLHAEADALTSVIKRMAATTCPCGLSMLSDSEIAANYCDACDKVLSNVRDDLSKTAANNEGKPLNKPIRTPDGPKKFSVYVKDGDSVKKVNFGDPNMSIKRDNPERRKNFRARHNCENPGPKTKARYWSCKMWEAGKSVSEITK